VAELRRGARELASRRAWTATGACPFGDIGRQRAAELLGLGDDPALMRIDSTIPDGLAVLYIGQRANPTPILGGLLVTIPHIAAFFYTTDEQGDVVDVVNGNGPSTQYYQAAVTAR
jgi:hypothetical protein